MEQVRLDKIYKFIKNVFRVAFESADCRCLVCDTQIANREDYLCTDCKQQLSIADSPKCEVCGRLAHDGKCRYCKEQQKPYERIYTVFEYAEPVDKFINEFKEQGKTIYGRMFVKSLLEKYDSFGIENIDLIAGVPANKIRKIMRLRDAPKFFARALSKHTGIKYTDRCLKRKGFAKAMRKKTPRQRMKLAGKSYAAGKYNVENKNILLVDDVFTTGATTHVCAKLLLDSGAKSVNIVAMICVKNR